MSTNAYIDNHKGFLAIRKWNETMLIWEGEGDEKRTTMKVDSIIRPSFQEVGNPTIAIHSHNGQTASAVYG